MSYDPDLDYDPDLPYDAETQRIKREREADAVEVPEPYTPAEWAETEGARQARTVKRDRFHHADRD